MMGKLSQVVLSGIVAQSFASLAVNALSLKYE